MKKRIFLTVIWAYVAWYAAALFAVFVGVTDAIGPIVAALVAVVVWFAPRWQAGLPRTVRLQSRGSRARL